MRFITTVLPYLRMHARAHACLISWLWPRRDAQFGNKPSNYGAANAWADLIKELEATPGVKNRWPWCMNDAVVFFFFCSGSAMGRFLSL